MLTEPKAAKHRWNDGRFGFKLDLRWDASDFRAGPLSLVECTQRDDCSQAKEIFSALIGTGGVQGQGQTVERLLT